MLDTNKVVQKCHCWTPCSLAIAVGHRNSNFLVSDKDDFGFVVLGVVYQGVMYPTK